jgi:tetratricopeptide (TPR) repeat protein
MRWIRLAVIGALVTLWAGMPASSSAFEIGGNSMLRVSDAGAAETAKRAVKLDELFRLLKTPLGGVDAAAITAQIWDLWLQSGRKDIDASMRIAVLEMGNGNLGAARMILDDIVERAPKFAEGWNKRATLLYMMGEHDASLADIERTLALEPRHFGALSGRGLIMLAKGRAKAALEAFRGAVAVNPHLKEGETIIPMLEKRIEGDPT